MKRWMLAAATLLLCLSAAAAQAITITGLESESVSREWENNAFFPRMRELTGVEMLPHGMDEEKEYAAAIDAMMGGKLPADVLFKAALSRETEIALLDAGAIIDLAPLIEENMPNLSALLNAHPDWRRSITLQDGRIASLPQLSETERQVCVWINRAWLEKLGLPMPQTVDELTAALLAMKTRDPNGNYDADEVAADLTGVYEMRWLLPFFGVVADDYNLARDAQGEIVFAPELSQYRAFVETLRGWYEQGILTSEAFTGLHSTQTYMASSSKSDEPVTSGLIVTVAPYTHIAANAVLDFEPLLIAGPDGSVHWRDLLGGVWTGCFAVTASCEDPAAALRWADALYAEAGALLAYAGVEGEDYAVGESGDWSFIVDDLRTVETIRAETIIYTGEIMPGLVPNDFLRRADSEIDRYVIEHGARVQEVAERVTIPYALGQAEQARADELAAVIGGLVDRGIARFVTGEIELSDENWNDWLASLREAGSEELTALFQAAK